MEGFVLVFSIGHGGTTNSDEMVPSGGRNIELGCIDELITTDN